MMRILVMQTASRPAGIASGNPDALSSSRRYAVHHFLCLTLSRLAIRLLTLSWRPREVVALTLHPVWSAGEVTIVLAI